MAAKSKTEQTRADRRQVLGAAQRYYVRPTQDRLDALLEAVKSLGTKAPKVETTAPPPVEVETENFERA